MFIREGTKVAVSDLIKGMIIQSGNDASVALAEHVAGSEENFAYLMNEYATQLGMQSSSFNYSSSQMSVSLKIVCVTKNNIVFFFFNIS